MGLTRDVVRCNHKLTNGEFVVTCKLSPGHRHVDHLDWSRGKTVSWTTRGTVSESNDLNWSVGATYSLDDELAVLLRTLDFTEITQ